MKNKVQHLSQTDQMKFDWALNMCARDQQKMNLNTLSQREKEIKFANEQRSYKKKLFNNSREIIDFLKFESALVIFYVPKLDNLEITYNIVDSTTMILKATDKKSQVYCLFEVTKENSKYRLNFIKVDYSLIKTVEKALKYA